MRRHSTPYAENAPPAGQRLGWWCRRSTITATTCGSYLPPL